MIRFLPVLLFALSITGCASFRGIPSHGGGKRFDEEQRIVAGCIRYAIDDMRFAELAGKRVRLQITSMPTSGAGNLNPGGLQDISLGLNYYDLAYEMARILEPFTPTSYSATRRWNEDDQRWENYQVVNNASPNSTQNTGETRSEDRTTWNAGLRYSLDHSYFTTRENTEGDKAYLQAVLNMKAVHDGISIVGETGDCMLYVLVDVLGTNRRRREYVLWKRDDLAATCELTYYARNLKTGELIFPARRAAGRAVYLEDRVWPIGWEHVSRTFSGCEVTPFPTSCSDGDRLAASTYVNGDAGTSSSNGEMQEEEHETADLLVERARAQLRVGNRKDAMQSLEQVINLEPTHPGLQEIEDEFNLELQ